MQWATDPIGQFTRPQRLMGQAVKQRRFRTDRCRRRSGPLDTPPFRALDRVRDEGLDRYERAGPIREQCVRPCTRRAVDGPRNGPYVTPEVESMIHGDQRPRASAGLDHHDRRGAESRQHAVATRKVVGSRARTRCELTDHKAPLDHLPEQTGVGLRVRYIGPGPQYGDGVSCNVQRASMRFPVRAQGEATYHNGPRASHTSGEVAGDLSPPRRYPTRTDDGDGGASRQQIDASAQEEDRWRIGEVQEVTGIPGGTPRQHGHSEFVRPSQRTVDPVRERPVSASSGCLPTGNAREQCVWGIEGGSSTTERAHKSGHPGRTDPGKRIEKEEVASSIFCLILPSGQGAHHSSSVPLPRSSATTC